MLGLVSPSATAEIRAEVEVLVVSTCLRLAPVLADTKEVTGVLTLPSPGVTAVEVDRRVDSTLLVVFEDPEDFLGMPESRSDTNYLL